MATDEDDGARGGRRMKVVRLIDEYDLGDVGAELERRWTAEGEDRSSLRDLADYFNVRVLERALATAGDQPLDGEARNLYRLLTDEDVSEADRNRTRRRLERRGIDTDGLLSDFVTYQAIRTYLTEYRDAEYTADAGPGIETERRNVQRLQGRVATVTESKLDALADAGEITLGSARCLVDVDVICEDCGTQYEATELLDRGGCDCEPAG